MSGVSKKEVEDFISMFPTTSENPKIVRISSYKKTGKQEYEISLDQDISSISAYELVRRDK